MYRNLRSLFHIVFFLTVLFTVQSVGFAQSVGLQLEKQYFAPGEDIRVQFTAPYAFARDAWVGIIPSHVPHGSEAVNDQHDLTYQYIEKRTAGMLVFKAPTAYGKYDLRMHDTDSNGREVFSITFTVGPGLSGEFGLELSKQAFAPGEAIQVRFTAPPTLARDAWVGIIPSHITHGSEAVNDQHDIAYQYIEGRTSGVMTFTAPQKYGSYDLRMNTTDNNGKEVWSVTFSVGEYSAGQSSLQTDKLVYRRGESIQLRFTAPSTFARDAWIGIIPSHVSHGSETLNDQHDISYQYIEQRIGGTMIFTAPQKPGQYDFRMNDTDSNGKEVVFATFTVQ